MGPHCGVPWPQAEPFAKSLLNANTAGGCADGADGPGRPEQRRVLCLWHGPAWGGGPLGWPAVIQGVGVPP